MRAFVLCAVLAFLFPASALAGPSEVVFHCGKHWITFSEEYPRGVLNMTVRKKDIRSLYTTKRTHEGKEIAPARVIILDTAAKLDWIDRKANDGIALAIREDIWWRIIQCLD